MPPQKSSSGTGTTSTDTAEVLHKLMLVTETGSESENLELLGPLLQSIFDSKREKQFLTQLSGFIKQKDGEIEKMCNANYQEFVHSVDQLLKVRQGTLSLKNKIVNLNGELQRSGTKLVAKKEELIETRKIQCNIESTIDTMRTCLHVLELANKASTHIEQRKYYSALKTLDNLQTQHLRQVGQYEFAQHMQEGIPVMKNQIKEAVTNELKEWLFRVRQSSRKIGQLAMEQMRVRQERWRLKIKQNANIKPSYAVNSAIEQVLNEETECNILDNEEVRFDFRPLYQCIHIYDALGKRNELRASYEEDRRAQANLALTSTVLLDNDLSTLTALLEEIVGFFIVEHEVMHSTTDFRSPNEVYKLWDMVITQILRMVSEGLRGCDNPDVFLSVRHLLMTFMQTLEGYAFPMKELGDLLLACFEGYSDLLRRQFRSRFTQYVEEDDCMPMVIRSEEEMIELRRHSRFIEDQKTTSQRFPRTLPFSKMFPLCCRDIRKFVHRYHRFAEGLSQQRDAIDEILKRSLDELLVQQVNGILLSKLESTNLSQIVQIIINLEYFENACTEFEELLTPARSGSSGRISLRAVNVFREARKNAEKRIFELVNRKIDDFLELADYEWTPSSVSDQPSVYLQELVSFLTTVINSTLANLPVSIKIFIYFDALDHLATSLQNILLSPNVTSINDNFVQNFNVDVEFLEEFVRSLNDPNVLDTFLELRQMMTLLQSESADEYLNPQTRNKRYSRLRPSVVASLFEKMLRDNTYSLKDRQRRRAMETVLRTLRSA
ncbi:uncharacterized protein VTP21DRAFT_11418 [Calcarisporiella thermophila]|uniref:uncharacterized protein n=1 Tax=Calcarisporiella thermophila TaxID=911321 RepID=UPI003743608E